MPVINLKGIRELVKAGKINPPAPEDKMPRVSYEIPETFWQNAKLIYPKQE